MKLRAILIYAVLGGLFGAFGGAVFWYRYSWRWEVNVPPLVASMAGGAIIGAIAAGIAFSGKARQ